MVMKILRVVGTLALAVIVVMLGGAACSHVQLPEMLEETRAEGDLPAIGAAVVKAGKTIVSGVAGTRRAGVDLPVQINDRFHLGSDTKAMTALMAAILVEQGKLKWDSTMAEVFPELKETMDDKVKGVTLQELMSHTSGMPSDNEKFKELLIASFEQDGNLNDARYWLVKEWCKLPLVTDPGKTFAYSNMGYIIVGAMIERTCGASWEELIVKQVFEPFDMKTAGLGCQASLGRIDAPVGHVIRDGKVVPRLAGPNGDNPMVIGPAGTCHMSVLDFAKWAGWNAGNGKREPKLVRPETVSKIHSPVIEIPPRPGAPAGTSPRGEYALGWGLVTVDWAPYPLIYHGGSNCMNLAHIWIDKKKDIAVVVVTNISSPKADAALRKLVAKLYAIATD